MPRVLTVVGCKNAGKTRSIELLVPVLQSQKLAVGTLKHTEHDGFNWDVKGKDTYRHFEAGSDITGIFGTNTYAFNVNTESVGRIQLARLVGLFYRDMDLVLIEGLKTAPGLKIEICREGFTDRKLASVENILATYGDNIHKYEQPHYGFGQEAQLGEHIVANLNRLWEVPAE